MMRVAMQRRLSASQRVTQQAATRAARDRIEEAASETGGSGNSALAMALPAGALELGMEQFAAMDAAADFRNRDLTAPGSPGGGIGGGGVPTAGGHIIGTGFSPRQGQLSGGTGFSPRGDGGMLSDSKGRLGLSPRLAALSLLDDQNPALTMHRHPLGGSPRGGHGGGLPTLDGEAPLPAPAVGRHDHVSVHSTAGLGPTPYAWDTGAGSHGPFAGGMYALPPPRRRSLTTPAQDSAARAWSRPAAPAAPQPRAPAPVSPVEPDDEAAAMAAWAASLPDPRNRAHTSASLYSFAHDSAAGRDPTQGSF